MENETNDGELTSSMGNVFGTPPAKDEKSDSNDSTPTSSTDANKSASASKIVTDDPISSTSSDTTGGNVCKKKELSERESRMRRDQLDSSSALLVSANALSDLLYMNITDVSNEKITEDVEDIVQDLENLLGESSSFSTDFKNDEAVSYTESSSAAPKAGEESVTDAFSDGAEVEKKELDAETETIDEAPVILETVEKEELIVETGTVDKIPEILETVETEQPIPETEPVDKIPEILETVATEELIPETGTVDKVPEILETFETVETEDAIAETGTVDIIPEIPQTAAQTELAAGDEKYPELPEKNVIDEDAGEDATQEKIDEETEEREINIDPVPAVEEPSSRQSVQDSATAPDQIIEIEKEEPGVEELPESGDVKPEDNLQEEVEHSSSPQNLIEVTKLSENKHLDDESNEDKDSETKEVTQTGFLSEKVEDKDETDDNIPEINSENVPEISDISDKRDDTELVQAAEEVCVKEVFSEEEAMIPEDVDLKQNIATTEKSTKSAEVDVVKPSRPENEITEETAAVADKEPCEDPLLDEGKEPKAVKTTAYICGADEQESEETSDRNLSVAGLGDSSKFEIIEEDSDRQTGVPQPALEEFQKIDESGDPAGQNVSSEGEKLELAEEEEEPVKSLEIECHDETPREISITAVEVKNDAAEAESLPESTEEATEEIIENADLIVEGGEELQNMPILDSNVELQEEEAIEQGQGEEQSSKPDEEEVAADEPSKMGEERDEPVLEETNSTNLKLLETEPAPSPEPEQESESPVSEESAAADGIEKHQHKNESDSEEAKDSQSEIQEIVPVPVPVPPKVEKIEKSEKTKQVHFEERSSSEDSPEPLVPEAPEPKPCKKTRSTKSPEPTVAECDEKEEQKGSLKMTITKQSDSRHSIFKVSSPPEVACLDHPETEHDVSEPVVPKLILKSVGEQQEHAKGAGRTNKSVPANTQRSGSPRITIKTIVKPEILSPLKITISKGKSDDVGHKQKHSPKSSKSKTENESAHHHSPRRSLKLKQLDQEHACSPKITIKPIPKPSDFAPETTAGAQHNPKITFKPVVDPSESENVHDDSVKERIVLKINKSKKREMAEKADDERPEKLAKIKLKFGKAGEHPHIVHPEANEDESIKRLLESDLQEHEKSKRIRLESGVSSETQSRLKDLLNSKGIVAASSQEVTTLQADLIEVSSNTNTGTGTGTAVSSKADPAPEILPSYDLSSEALKPVVAAVPVPVPPSGPRKRGRPRKVPLVIREEFKDDSQPQQPKVDPQPKQQRPVYESTRPKRSCRGQSARVTLGIKPRKPRGSGRGRGSRGGGNSLAVTMKPGKEPKQSSGKLKRLKESVSALVEEAKLTASAKKKSLGEAIKISAQQQQQQAPEPAERKIEEAPEIAAEIEPAVAAGVEPGGAGAPAAYSGAAIVSSTPVSTASNESSSGIQDIVMFEEETRMSADISSRAQTPEKKILPGDMVEESQSSILSTATTESAKLRRGSRLEVHQEPEGSVISADQLAEYSWGNMGPFMLQEQVAQFLGIKSFKRKYPNIQRRMVDMQERDFIREMGLASEAMCDLGLTAVNSADILDIMYSDFQDKYEEYCKHQRDRQAKELINKQKALSLAASLEKNKLDIMQQAMKSAMQWNVNFNKTRREQRRACMDLQTLTVHYPKGKIKPPPKDPIGPYPVAVVPGQFTDYYKEYTSTEISNLPLNSLCYEPIRKLNAEEMEVDSQSEDSGTESASSSSGSDSSDSESSDDDCKICKEQKAAAVSGKKVAGGSA